VNYAARICELRRAFVNYAARICELLGRLSAFVF
jgi:hypothetical protein